MVAIDNDARDAGVHEGDAMEESVGGSRVGRQSSMLTVDRGGSEQQESARESTILSGTDMGSVVEILESVEYM